MLIFCNDQVLVLLLNTHAHILSMSSQACEFDCGISNLSLVWFHVLHFFLKGEKGLLFSFLIKTCRSLFIFYQSIDIVRHHSLNNT